MYYDLSYETEHTCSICTEEIEHPCELHCKHYYHGKCIDQWINSLEYQSREIICPTCDATITDQDYQKIRIASINDTHIPDSDFENYQRHHMNSLLDDYNDD